MITKVHDWNFANSGRSGIQRAYKEGVALISFCGDYGYELTEQEKSALINVLEAAESFSHFFDILPAGFAERFRVSDNSGWSVCAESFNGYTCWSIESRSDSVTF